MPPEITHGPQRQRKNETPPTILRFYFAALKSLKTNKLRSGGMAKTAAEKPPCGVSTPPKEKTYIEGEIFPAETITPTANGNSMGYLADDIDEQSEMAKLIEQQMREGKLRTYYDPELHDLVLFKPGITTADPQDPHRN